jgi:galactokinase
LLIVNTQVRHKNAESGYAERRAQCIQAARILGVRALRDAKLLMLKSAQSKLGKVLYRRARHVVLENERTLEAAAAIEESDWTTLGKLMYDSHESLRQDYEASSRELDLVVSSAREIGTNGGVIGCRMTGGGFGGCAICLVQTESIQHVTRKLAEVYEQETGDEVEIFSSRPAAGARILDKSRAGAYASRGTKVFAGRAGPTRTSQAL